METNKILTADFLDILFDGRNKLYGAYDLRKTYNSRVSKSLLVTCSIFIFIVGGAYLAKSMSGKNSISERIVKEVALSKPPEEKVKPIPVVVPPVVTPPVRTIANPPPKIVVDIDVVKPPPDIQELLDAKIDLKTQDGVKDDYHIAVPTEEKNSSVILAPVRKASEPDSTFIAVQIQAAFPGGDEGWIKYVKRAVENNVDELTEAGESGTCRVKFIVDKAGSVSEVEALTLKGTKLAEIAVNAIRKGPRWTPAQQNGRFVKAFREQPITFSIDEK